VDRSYRYSITENKHGTVLKHEDSFKDLGVLIHEKLTFGDHIHDKII